MAIRKGKTGVVAEPTITLGDFTLDTAAVAALAPIDVKAKGIVLLNERIPKLFITLQDEHGRPVPVAFKVSLYIEREAINEAELDEVTSTAAEQTANREKREREEQDKRDREIRRSVDLTKEVVYGQFNDLARMNQAAENMARAMGLRK